MIYKQKPTVYTRYDRGVVSECRELELKNGVPLILGLVEESQEDICLDRVPIVTPNCDVVVSSLSIQVHFVKLYAYAGSFKAH